MLDKKQAEEFFNKVKGKEIRWVHAHGKSEARFTPIKLIQEPTGFFMEGDTGAGWYVVNGFNKIPNNGYWERTVDVVEENQYIGCDYAFTPDDIPGNKCECGKDKHGFASHSDWCNKYERKGY